VSYKSQLNPNTLTLNKTQESRIQVKGLLPLDAKDYKKPFKSHEEKHPGKYYTKCYFKWKSWASGKAPRQRAVYKEIQFGNLKYPNYPGDPLPRKMLNHRKEFNVHRQLKNVYRHEAVKQFAPFRRTVYNVFKSSNTLLPTPIFLWMGLRVRLGLHVCTIQSLKPST